DVSETLASVLAREPDWTALPTTVAPAIRTLLRRSLDKDRRNRIGDIAVARFAIEESGALAAAASANDAEVQSRIDMAVATVRRGLAKSTRQRVVLIGAVAVLAGSGFAAAAMWFATRPTPPRVVQLTVATTSATALTMNGTDRDLAITPDGSR